MCSKSRDLAQVEKYVIITLVIHTKDAYEYYIYKEESN